MKQQKKYYIGLINNIDTYLRYIYQNRNLDKNINYLFIYLR